MNKKSIGVLICYYGKFPWYFDYFLHSCNYNQSVDFLIVTDIQDYLKPLPRNVKFIFKTIDDINILASQKLGFEVKIKHPYKFCDFKPAYGLIFSELLLKYDYWAQSDIDIIFGNIRSFLNEETLSYYDFISMRHDYTTGCFALYKNSSLMNNLFKRSKDYKKVFSSDQDFAFDESNFVNNSLTEGISIFEIKTEIESFTQVIKSAEHNNEIKAHFDFILIEGLTGKIKFDKGKIVYRNQFEAILYHLYLLKHAFKPKKIRKNIPDKYYISNKNIYY